MMRRGIILFAVVLTALSLGVAAAQENELAGVWLHKGAGGFTSELIIFPDGRFQKQDSQGGHQTLISGPIQKIPNPPTLRLNIKDYAPKQWCGPLGCTTIRMPAAEMYRYKVEGKVLLLWDQQGKWPYQRIR
ncbi:MAG TPA: hypothetical protein VK445_03900 [Dissulfurispiraceae bacterium]|nr:hypothetical protein [Dissulfurispiraceae bacterium]